MESVAFMRRCAIQKRIAIHICHEVRHDHFNTVTCKTYPNYRNNSMSL